MMSVQYIGVVIDFIQYPHCGHIMPLTPLVDFQDPADTNSEEESGDDDEMHNDAINADLLDTEVEEWNRNRADETQQQMEQQQVELTGGDEVCHLSKYTRIQCNNAPS